MRGQLRIAHDFALLAAAVSLARLAVVGLMRSPDSGGEMSIEGGDLSAPPCPV
jgi:hypothetical protein